MQSSRYYQLDRSEMIENVDEDESPQWANYMSCFPDDDEGVPRFCKQKYCPLNHDNPLTNDNDLVRKISPFGYRYFDKHRKVYFGFASMFTIFAMIMTTYGCFALSTDRSIVQRTYWAGGTGSNVTTGLEFSMYVGLRSVEYVNCSFIHGYQSYASNCVRESILYSDSACSSGPVSAACSSCSSVATSMWATAFMSCACLILSFMGAQTRMRKIGDVPVQKIVNMFAEAWGGGSLAFALFTFQNDCFTNLHDAFNIADVSTRFWIGPGLYCYAICCVSGIIRGTVHWVTPLPTYGATTFFQLCSSNYWKTALLQVKRDHEVAVVKAGRREVEEGGVGVELKNVLHESLA